MKTYFKNYIKKKNIREAFFNIKYLNNNNIKKSNLINTKYI